MNDLAQPIEVVQPNPLDIPAPFKREVEPQFVQNEDDRQDNAVEVAQ